MDWGALERRIPYLRADQSLGLHSHRTTVEQGRGFTVEALSPGKHWRETSPAGGDFVLEVTSSTAITWEGKTWTSRRFTHEDLLSDIAVKTLRQPEFMQGVFGPLLTAVVALGDDPNSAVEARPIELPGLEPTALLVVSQSLALCEHRRYAAYEPVGGRYLPLRLSLGIIYGTWSDGVAREVWRQGRRGLEALRRRYGVEPAIRAILERESAAAGPAIKEARG